jgi:hypothetical protein
VYTKVVIDIREKPWVVATAYQINNVKEYGRTKCIYEKE